MKAAVAAYLAGNGSMIVNIASLMLSSFSLSIIARQVTCKSSRGGVSASAKLQAGSTIAPSS